MRRRRIVLLWSLDKGRQTNPPDLSKQSACFTASRETFPSSDPPPKRFKKPSTDGVEGLASRGQLAPVANPPAGPYKVRV